MEKKEYKGGARSFNGAKIDDSLQINLNIKWLIQIICGISLLTYSYFRLETKLEEIERNLLTAQEQLSDMIEKHKIEDELKVKQMEEQLQWFQKELDLNPMSWLRKGKKKK